MGCPFCSGATHTTQREPGSRHNQSKHSRYRWPICCGQQSNACFRSIYFRIYLRRSAFHSSLHQSWTVDTVILPLFQDTVSSRKTTNAKQNNRLLPRIPPFCLIISREILNFSKVPVTYFAMLFLPELSLEVSKKLSIAPLDGSQTRPRTARRHSQQVPSNLKRMLVCFTSLVSFKLTCRSTIRYIFNNYHIGLFVIVIVNCHIHYLNCNCLYV